MKFINNTTNVCAPSGYFSPDVISYLINTYGETALDGGRTVSTIYCRQDTEDINSRRACSPENESPQTFNNGNILILSVYPTTGIYNAVINNQLSGVFIVPQEELGGFLAQYAINQEE